MWIRHVRGRSLDRAQGARSTGQNWHCNPVRSCSSLKTGAPHPASVTNTPGQMSILLTTSQSPKAHLFTRFWLHEDRYPFVFPDAVIDSLKTLEIAHKVELIPGELDFMECFQDGFQKLHQKFLLDFITHTKMVRYPAAISQVCIEFLTSTSIGKPQKYIISFSVAFIVC